MRAADWRVTGDVTDFPVLGVFADKAGIGGGELRSIHIYVNDAKKGIKLTRIYLLHRGKTGFQIVGENITNLEFSASHHLIPPKRNIWHKIQ
jgi:hypothetical protein